MKSNVTMAQKSAGHIYIVDDEIDILTGMTEILQSYNYKVNFFSNCKNLLDSIHESSLPDLVISDIQMPEMSGLDLLKETRQRNLTVPFIFISGFMDTEIILEALSLGASGFVEKPFHEGDIISLVQNVIKKNRALDLLNRSIHCLYYQFRELDSYLVESNKSALRDLLKDELENLIEQRNQLNELL